MKRILVVDESRAVRETLSLLLGRDFVVVQRPPRENVAESDEQIDLLILGISPAWATESSSLARIASRVPSAVLFLVDSESVVTPRWDEGNVDCLAKPFSPYELKEKVTRLLTDRSRRAAALKLPGQPPGKRHDRYIQFPYLSRTTALLARRFAVAGFPVLIQAEVGCAPERIARAMFESNPNAGPWFSLSAMDFSDDRMLHRFADLLQAAGQGFQCATLFIDGVESLRHLAQSSLLKFFEEGEQQGKQFWILATSKIDLLEKVYSGDFSANLYYRLATLTLRVQPLRERQAELPVLLSKIAEDCGFRLGLGKIKFSPAAVERFCNYLWFGNLREMEAVISRTLATHQKNLIEASDLILDLAEDLELLMDAQEASELNLQDGQRNHAASREEAPAAWPQTTNGNSADLKVLLNELAHELKNPMVTIKTFSQLLDERFNDAVFRTRFRETVSGDIERMNDLLETLLEFSRFQRPTIQSLRLSEQLRRVGEEMLTEFHKKEIAARHGEVEKGGEVFADEAQLQYVLKSVLRSALSEAKTKGEISIGAEGQGVVSISYCRESGRVFSLTHYLDPVAVGIDKDALPLRILLSKILLERNGGGMELSHNVNGEVTIRIELPVTEHGAEEP